MKRLLSAALVLGLGCAFALAQRNPPASSGQLPAPSVNIEIKAPYRYITSNGIPNHETGTFPNRHNPNSISAQNYKFRVPLAPTSRPTGTPLRRALFGVALNGIVFDPGTAEAWKNDQRTGWNIEAIPPAGVKSMNLGLDSSQAHVQPNGAYHYHAIPYALIAKLSAGRTSPMLLVGYAADGFPIYNETGPTDPMNLTSPSKTLTSSYRLRSGTRPSGEIGPGGKYDGTYTQDYEYIASLGDLDEANGRFGITPEYPKGTYYYVLTESWPYIPRMLKGTADDSFSHKGGPPPGRGRPGQNGGGPGEGPGGGPPGGGPNGGPPPL